MFESREFISGLSLAIYLFTFPANAHAATLDTQKLSCPKNDKIRALAQSAWNERGHDSTFALFASEPAAAACYLIQELGVVPETWIRGGDQKKHPKTMHVIWSLRALRYITGGLNFKGGTKYRFKSSDEIESNRRQFLRPEGDEIPFFAVWMSRDSLAIAPQDAQRAIIEKWVKWYGANGPIYNYDRSETVEDWYF